MHLLFGVRFGKARLRVRELRRRISATADSARREITEEPSVNRASRQVKALRAAHLKRTPNWIAFDSVAEFVAFER